MFFKCISDNWRFDEISLNIFDVTFASSGRTTEYCDSRKKGQNIVDNFSKSLYECSVCLKSYKVKGSLQRHQQYEVADKMAQGGVRVRGGHTVELQ